MSRELTQSPADMTQGQAPPRSQVRGLVCAGLYGSASTWMFNLAAQILKIGGRTGVGTVYLDDVADGGAKAFAGHSFIVAKSHMPGPGLRALLDLGHLSLIVTLREPRDAVASLMLRWNLGFDLALRRVEKSAAALAGLAGCRPALRYRYEERFMVREDTIDAVAQWLGVMLTPQARGDLFAGLVPRAIEARIEAWQRSGVLGNGPPDVEFEPATHWHLGHIGDGQSGKWPKAFTAAQAARVLQVTRIYCQAFGYPTG